MKKFKQTISNDEIRLILENDTNGYYQLNKNIMNGLNSVNKAVYLTILIDAYRYHFKKNQLKDQTFYMTHKEVIKRIPISEGTISRMKKELKEDGIIFTTMKGRPAKEHIWIDFEKVKYLFLGEFQSKFSSLTENERLRPLHFKPPPKQGGLSPHQNRGGYIRINNKRINNKNLSGRFLKKENGLIMEWDDKMKCYQFKNHPMGIIRTLAVNQKHPHKASVWHPSHILSPKNKVYRSMGKKLARNLKRKGLLNANATQLAFGRAFFELISKNPKNILKSETTRDRIKEVQEWIDNYCKWMGEPYIAVISSGKSLIAKYSQVARNINNQNRKNKNNRGQSGKLNLGPALYPDNTKKDTHIRYD